MFWGAGMVFRTNVLQDIYSAGMHSLLSDRQGVLLSSGGVSEICKWFLLKGYNIWCSESLKLFHFIPQGRLNDEYLGELLNSLRESNKILFSYDRILMYCNDVSRQGSFMLCLKALFRLLLIHIGFSRHYKVKKWKNHLVYLPLQEPTKPQIQIPSEGVGKHFWNFYTKSAYMEKWSNI
jgi:hypothetical protein